MLKKIFINISIMMSLLSVSITSVFAGGSDIVSNLYFSINIPDSWTYIEYSGNEIWLTPHEFSDLLLINDAAQITQKLPDGGAFASFFQDSYYRIKNAPLESYVKYVIDRQGILNITSQQYTTIGKEKSVKIYANNLAGLDNTKIALYTVMDDDQPYAMVYVANTENYEKNLPEFEQMVKSFRFVDSPSSEFENLSENENITNTATNFSGANLTELNTEGTSDSNYPEELYDECVSVAGKSFCDFLFKR